MRIADFSSWSSTPARWAAIFTRWHSSSLPYRLRLARDAHGRCSFDSIHDPDRDLSLSLYFTSSYWILELFFFIPLFDFTIRSFILLYSPIGNHPHTHSPHCFEDPSALALLLRGRSLLLLSKPNQTLHKTINCTNMYHHTHCKTIHTLTAHPPPYPISPYPVTQRPYHKPHLPHTTYTSTYTYDITSSPSYTR
jgi:hypothetical protein